MVKVQKWTTLDSRLVLDNKWCRVRQDKVQLPNGTVVDDYFVNVRPDIALILPITPEQEIVFVRQYRHGVQAILLELPAGTFNSQKEDSLIAAKRELLEETGYTATQFTHIATLYDNPVKDSNQIYLFIAENATFIKEQQLDITEEIEVILVPISQVKTKILQGEICVCGSITGIFLGLDFLANSQK
jgi:8-oxo-dGTP pyrophosphatase MutT (NUDIX family)